MHKVIKIICYASDEKEAREKAEHILNESLVGEWKSFDYGTFFDEESSVSGKSRWGNLPVVCLADSKEGKKLIADGMKFTREEFEDDIKEVRNLLNNYSNEELFEKEVMDVKTKILEKLEGKDKKLSISMFKYYCNCISQSRGYGIYLFDNDGESIGDNNHLKSVLSKWKGIYEEKQKENPYKNLKVFVVPCDVHY